MAQNLRDYKLANGMRVILQPTETQTFAGALYVTAGSAEEAKGEEGLVHFLEHCLINGGTAKFNPDDFEKLKESFGFSNAITNKRRMIFPVRSYAEDLKLFLDSISEVAISPRFDPRVVEEQRQRVLREMAQKRGTPDYKDIVEFREAVFGVNIESRENLGDHKVVSSATVEDLRRMHKRTFSPNYSTLIIVGKMDADVETSISEKFSGWNSTDFVPYEFDEIRLIGQHIIIHRSAPDLLDPLNPDKSNCFFRMGCIVPSETDPETYAMTALGWYLGNKIQKEISRKKGLSYGVGASYDGRPHLGFFVFGGKILASRKDEALDLIFEEIKMVQEGDIDVELLERVKRKSLFHILECSESNIQRINQLGLLLDSEIELETRILNLRSVTAKQIQEVAQKYLPASREDKKYVLLLRDPLKQ